VIHLWAQFQYNEFVTYKSFPPATFVILNTNSLCFVYNLYRLVYHLIIIITTSGSTVLVRTLAALHWRFRNLSKTLGRLLWSSDQPVAKASTYTRQHNTNTKTNIHATSGIRTHDPRNQAADLRLIPRGHWDRLFITQSFTPLVPGLHQLPPSNQNLKSCFTLHKNKYFLLFGCPLTHKTARPCIKNS
jgi:hypothetical protein